MKLSKKGKRGFIVYCTLVLMLSLFATPAYAANDPLQVVNNLSNFIFGLIRAIGMILLGFESHYWLTGGKNGIPNNRKDAHSFP